MITASGIPIYLTPDPIGLAGGINPYVYANNRPTVEIDLMGLYGKDVHYDKTYEWARSVGLDHCLGACRTFSHQYVLA